ncbi:MAG: hypothetical protein WCL02_09145 [bacterium]
MIPAATSSIIIWLLYGYAHKRIIKFKAKRDNKDWISRLEKKLATYIENRK